MLGRNGRSSPPPTRHWKLCIKDASRMPSSPLDFTLGPVAQVRATAPVKGTTSVDSDARDAWAGDRARAQPARPTTAPASAGIGATLSQCHAARIIIRHPFNPAPHPQHHRRLALSNDLAYDENPAAAVGTRIATSASVRAEKRAVDRRILVDDDWWRVGHAGTPFSSLFSLGAYRTVPVSPPPRFAPRRRAPRRGRRG